MPLLEVSSSIILHPEVMPRHPAPSAASLHVEKTTSSFDRRWTYQRQSTAASHPYGIHRPRRRGSARQQDFRKFCPRAQQPFQVTVPPNFKQRTYPTSSSSQLDSSRTPTPHWSRISMDLERKNFTRYHTSSTQEHHGKIHPLQAERRIASRLVWKLSSHETWNFLLSWKIGPALFFSKVTRVPYPPQKVYREVVEQRWQHLTGLTFASHGSNDVCVSGSDVLCHTRDSLAARLKRRLEREVVLEQTLLFAREFSVSSRYIYPLILSFPPSSVSQQTSSRYTHI